MKLTFEIETHRDKAGNFVAQVVLDGQVLHEQSGPASEQQAVSNVVTSFASLLTAVLDREDKRQVEECEEIHGT
jgi:hypothetical protein